MADSEWYYASGGQQLGPVTFDELLALTRNGTVRRDDLVWRSDFADWKPAASVPELWPSAAPAPSSGPVPPPPPVYRSQSAATGAQTNGFAIASIACGALSFVTFFCFISLPGIVCGHVARAQIRKRPDLYTGMDYAAVGLLLNYLNFILSLGFIALLFIGIASTTNWN